MPVYQQRNKWTSERLCNRHDIPISIYVFVSLWIACSDNNVVSLFAVKPFELYKLSSLPIGCCFQVLLVCLAVWLADWLAGWLTGYMSGWLAGWLASWLAGWLADWLYVTLYVRVTLFKVFFICSGKLMSYKSPWWVPSHSAEITYVRTCLISPDFRRYMYVTIPPPSPYQSTITASRTLSRVSDISMRYNV